ncbi:hypothetical protein BH10PSE10_BH10PSE10_08180 [soil metagenome]
MSKVVTYLASPDDPPWGSLMEFKLTYDGPLRPSGRDAENGQLVPLAGHKQELRKVFHRQLKHLWSTNKFLSEHKVHPAGRAVSPAEMPQLASHLGGGPDTRIQMSDTIAQNYARNGYKFVPLVREEVSLLCSLNILFLRHDFRRGVLSAGDLDNRIKTLIDGLRMPMNASELRGNEIPANDECPFFCLLADDNLVTALAVESDALLDVPPSNDPSYVRLVISVNLKPHNVTMENLSFA